MFYSCLNLLQTGVLATAVCLSVFAEVFSVCMSFLFLFLFYFVFMYGFVIHIINNNNNCMSYKISSQFQRLNESGLQTMTPLQSAIRNSHTLSITICISAVATRRVYRHEDPSILYHVHGATLNSETTLLKLIESGVGVMTSRPEWYHKHTAAMTTELLQLLDLVCGTLYQSSCAIQTLPTDCFDDS